MSQSKSIRAAYTGTFDPITNGHADVIRRAASMFSELIVAVASNASKKSIFDHAERVELAKQVLADVDNVVVMPVSGLIVDFARKHEVRVLVRGVRGVGDYEYEKQMAVMNRHLAPQVDTIFLAPSPEFAHISSTLVREIAFLDGRISGLVPGLVADKLHEKTAG
ncbi:phosphopantetheine adenylyltransferase [Salinisphaera orenii MK-B5]|uniref:Phosphopantetheine adenylyltransferase n=2 Tax=Salinisphaera orenii TaxID=856731 RepID=A0A423PW78_9GAMM|nr:MULTISPECIES: pantetheine-phosphate adenylyltransferase [Salinisphaera]ROO23742.1 phosphopantetheine adenylyltransferase [Salinisphaera halophila YIM 95161]ROO29866.1 phosphopantetheine adenylyltransferase [Salinisphaera orenii MK-B5]